jgi:hypothetical protein
VEENVRYNDFNAEWNEKLDGFSERGAPNSRYVFLITINGGASMIKLGATKERKFLYLPSDACKMSQGALLAEKFKI